MLLVVDMALGITPATFTITGSGFTPSGGVAIEVLNSSSSVVASTSTTADSNGDINATVQSSLILSIGQNKTGTYNGSIVLVDSSTGVSSNGLAISMSVIVVTPSISMSPTTFTFSEV